MPLYTQSVTELDPTWQNLDNRPATLVMVLVGLAALGCCWASAGWLLVTCCGWRASCGWVAGHPEHPLARPGGGPLAAIYLSRLVARLNSGSGRWPGRPAAAVVTARPAGGRGPAPARHAVPGMSRDSRPASDCPRIITPSPWRRIRPKSTSRRRAAAGLRRRRLVHLLRRAGSKRLPRRPAGTAHPAARRTMPGHPRGHPPGPRGGAEGRASAGGPLRGRQL